MIPGESWPHPGVDGSVSNITFLLTQPKGRKGLKRCYACVKTREPLVV